MISQDLSEKEASSGSVNKEWNHWVVLHGNDEVMVDDVKNIGAAIGVHLNERNMFGCLQERGKGRSQEMRVRFWRRNQWLEFEWGGWFGAWRRVLSNEVGVLEC